MTKSRLVPPMLIPPMLSGPNTPSFAGLYAVDANQGSSSKTAGSGEEAQSLHFTDALLSDTRWALGGSPRAPRKCGVIVREEKAHALPWCSPRGARKHRSKPPFSIAILFVVLLGPIAWSGCGNGGGGDGGSDLDSSDALVCVAQAAFAPQTLINSRNPITLLCTNNSMHKIAITNTSSGASGSLGGGKATYPDDVTEVFPSDTNADNNCASSQTVSLPKNGACQLNVIYEAPSSPVDYVSIALTVDYQDKYGKNYTASTSTSTRVVNKIDNERTIYLTNLCSFPVWWGMVGGAVTNSNGNNCPNGSYGSGNSCLYNGTAPTVGSYKLEANGGSATTVIMQTEASTSFDNVMWKGVISGQTKCIANNGCDNNDCVSSGGTKQCTKGFKQPATEAEFTFLLTGATNGAVNVDSYDITQVNGFSMPMSMGPRTQSEFSVPMSMGTSASTETDYRCATAGSITDQGTLKAANYTAISPPTNMYNWVSGYAADCSSCKNSEICGLAYDATQGFEKSCGNFLGYWSANQICQTDQSFTSPFGDQFYCAASLSPPLNGYNLGDLLKCMRPDKSEPLFNSCYLSYPNTTDAQDCCGCTDWTNIATPTVSCPTNQINPQWVSLVQPVIEWMKRANPTGYSYPYDDKASSFQCTADVTTKYEVIFCPGKQTGLPNGKTDGRS